MIKVVLAEDHHVVRAAVAAFLTKEPDIEVIGQVSDGASLSTAVAGLKPDVLILDAHMPGFKPIDVARSLRVQHPDVRILVLSAYNRSEYVIGLMQAGALGYVLKDDPPDTLVHAVRAVARNERWLTPRVTETLVNSVRNQRRGLTDLTDRETDVLRLIANGYRNDQIAETLHITEQTVKNHIRNIFSKLNVQTRVEAALYAISQGLVSAEQ